MTGKHVFVLCGGDTTKGGLRSPMNYVNGVPVLKRLLGNLKLGFTETLNIVYNAEVLGFDFPLWVKKECVFTGGPIPVFHAVSYLTRGPVETALLAVNKMGLGADAALVFVDSDIDVALDVTEMAGLSDLFIGANKLAAEDPCVDYCFLKVEVGGSEGLGTLTDICEKTRISDIYGVGVYGLPAGLFKSEALACVRDGFYYFSDLYKRLLLGQGEKPAVIYVGSSGSMSGGGKLRLCFDLDGTLVTFPQVAGDYSTVLPIHGTIEFLRQMKRMGHTIIINTARRMETCGGNVGAVVAGVGEVTFRTLREFGIPFDELLFGKPIADVYIDDKACNPRVSDVGEYLGFSWGGAASGAKPRNFLGCNKFNRIMLVDGCIVKTGPIGAIEGEAFALRSISAGGCADLVPKVLHYESGLIRMEYLRGIPLTKLWAEGLLTWEILSKSLDGIQRIHQISKSSQEGEVSQMNLWLKSKFTERISTVLALHKDTVAATICSNIAGLFEGYTCKSVVSSHGDPWFSNSILCNGGVKFLDPRGNSCGVVSLMLDAYYDYAKVLQSLLGFDGAIYNFGAPANSAELLANFFDYVETIGLNKKDLRIFAYMLMLGSVPFYENSDVRVRILNLLGFIWCDV